jgi:hypothetical protein
LTIYRNIVCGQGRYTAETMKNLMAIPREKRIAELVKKERQ